MKQITQCKAFIETVGRITLFDYQIEFLRSCLESNRVVGIFGRQMGKTTIIYNYCIYEAIQRNNITILIIAPTDRQAGELFSRLRNSAEMSGLISPFIESATLREIKFTNGSVVRAMPTGDFGHNIRGQTADIIILEESSYVKSDIVNQVIMPMIASKGEQGKVIQIGTPFFKNHFYEASMSDKYRVHQYDYTHSPLITKDFIEEQKLNLTSIEFAMEYEAKFIEDTDSYFNLALINSCITDYEYPKPHHGKSQYYLGVDFARMGQDSSVFVVVEKPWNEEKLYIAEIVETKHKMLTDAVGRITLLNEKYNFVKMFLDETGMGAGPSDMLKERFYATVEPVTFTVKSKQDIYSNLKVLMEQGKLKFINNKKLVYELLDLKYETSEFGNMKIHHSDRGHDDYPDALALACYEFRPKRGYIPTIV